MDRVFDDPETENEFRRKGYVVRPFLDRSEVARLRALHDTLPPDIPSDFYATVFSRNTDFRRRVSEGILEIAGAKLRALLPRHEACFGLFVVKRPKTDAASLPLHRDYTFVDPAKHTSVNVWFPLMDVDEENGCLRAVTASHKLMVSPYAVNEYPSPFRELRPVLEKDFVTRLPMAAGSAFVYDSRLLHGSGGNRTERARLACVSILIPRGAAPRVYVWNGPAPTRFDVLEVSKDFLLEMERGGSIREPYPAGVRYLSSEDYPVDPLAPNDLATLKRLQDELERS